jgi:hypothetical protein
MDRCDSCHTITVNQGNAQIQKTDRPNKRLTALSVFPINDSARVQLILLFQYRYYRETILIMHECDSRHNTIW